MSANETIHTSSTGAQKAGNLERYDLIPAEPIRQLAEHFGRGAKKYADRNWEAGYDWSLSFAALNRHLWQFWSGQDIDEETGSPHIIAVMWHAAVLAEFTHTHPGFDNRPGSAQARLARNPETIAKLEDARANVDDAVELTLDEPVTVASQAFWTDIDSGINECQPDAPRPARIVNQLGYHERHAQWTDRQGDTWRYHLPGTGFGRWEYFFKPSGEWDTAEPTDSYAPYTEVMQPRIVTELTHAESDAEWTGQCGRYRYDTAFARWTRNPGAPDFWHPTLCTGVTFGPYTEANRH